MNWVINQVCRLKKKFILWKNDSSSAKTVQKYIYILNLDMYKKAPVVK